MTADYAVDLVRHAVLTAALVAAPVLAAVFAASVLIALVQTMTSLHDPTVSLTPRLFVGGLCVVCLLAWMLERLTDFTTELYRGSTWGL